MIAKDQNIALLAIAKAASDKPDWTDYADYCIDREKGLRKQAFKKLNKFLKSTKHWTSDQKIEFAKFLFLFFETIQDVDYRIFPQPLRDKLIRLTLEQWCKNEKTDSRPFRWYGGYYSREDYIFKALKLNPQDDLARETLLNWWINDIYNSVLYLPESYIGDPHDDLKLAKRIKEHISQLTNSKRKDDWTKQLKEDLALVENYIDWKKS